MWRGKAIKSEQFYKLAVIQLLVGKVLLSNLEYTTTYQIACKLVVLESVHLCAESYRTT